MPMDLTRVMLFENLQYLIKDAEFEGLFKNVNPKLFNSSCLRGEFDPSIIW